MFHSNKSCQLEKLFGLNIETSMDGRTLVVQDFLPEARSIYSPKVEKGYHLYKINGIEVNKYNINMVLQRVSEDPGNAKLTFKVVNEIINIDIEKLLRMKSETEISSTPFLKESKCSIIYICNSTENDSNNENGVLYCYPRPYNQNFLYNTRGAYVTLNHLAPVSLGTSEPISSTVLSNNILINVIYVPQGNNLLLVALPNNILNQFAAKKTVGSIVRMLELLYGSLNTCFTKSNNIDKLDCLFSRIFSVLIMNRQNGDEEGSVCFEELLGAHSVGLPTDVKIQIDDAIAELESADYSEWVCFTNS